MKHLLLYLSLCLVGFGSIGQEANREYYEPISKRENTIVAINDSIAEVYTLVHIIDVAGRGNRLKKIDTLFKISNSGFLGPTYSLVIENESYLMNTNTGESLKIKIVESAKETTTKLNFAYYLGGYIDLSERIDSRYPHYHYSFRNGFYNWEKLSYKERDTKKFQELAKKELVHTYNEIVEFQNQIVKKFDYIIEHSNSLDYQSILDTLRFLHCSFLIDYNNRYFYEAIPKVCNANPEYFYRLVEDIRGASHQIYSAIRMDKELFKRIKKVPGYNFRQDFLRPFKSRTQIRC